ncbi:glycine-rich cell wall structural protein 1.0-like [Cryptomeria japonica]|uniref:glycine-rich cell wall structural protein 1.0-like n=1 Tax=Cryptomeria japonica TaxID=3369 RepID=UPI0027D9EC1A|nr:glycine-rich cell wall structural protein 1.0-like [Cryptomeria japonica]
MTCQCLCPRATGLLPRGGRGFACLDAAWRRMPERRCGSGAGGRLAGGAEAGAWRRRASLHGRRSGGDRGAAGGGHCRCREARTREAPRAVGAGAGRRGSREQRSRGAERQRLPRELGGGGAGASGGKRRWPRPRYGLRTAGVGRCVGRSRAELRGGAAAMTGELRLTAMEYGRRDALSGSGQWR